MAKKLRVTLIRSGINRPETAEADHPRARAAARWAAP